jgi:hypothetical protein
VDWNYIFASPIRSGCLKSTRSGKKEKFIDQVGQSTLSGSEEDYDDAAR